MFKAKLQKYVIQLCFFLCGLIQSSTSESTRTNGRLPTVLIAINALENEEALPYCINEIYHLDYDKQRISILIAGTSNECDWCDELSDLYHDISWHSSATFLNYTNDLIVRQENSLDTNNLRFNQFALDEARRKWADYLLIVKSVDFLANDGVLRWLITTSIDGDYWLLHPIVWNPFGHRKRDGTMTSLSKQFTSAEIMSKNELVSDWMGEIDSPTCIPTKDFNKDWLQTGTPELYSPLVIAMKHRESDILQFYPINLKTSKKEAANLLSSNSLIKAGCLARSAKADTACWQRSLEKVCLLAPASKWPFGFFMLNDADQNHDKMELLLNYTTKLFIRYQHKLESITVLPRLKRKSFAIKKFGANVKSLLSTKSEWLILLVNLQRRSLRRERSLYALRLAGLNDRVKLVQAVDREKLSGDGLQRLGVRMLPKFVDLTTNRDRLLYGEVACFLSHYSAWQRIAFDTRIQFALVLEDDFVLEMGFQRKFMRLLRILETRYQNNTWDLVYLGREPFYSHFGGRSDSFLDEDALSSNCTSHSMTCDASDNDFIIYSGYSHYTIGYLLSKQGAQKLIARNPLSKMVPVDQFLALVAYSHAVYDWYAAFEGVDFNITKFRADCSIMSEFGGEPNCGLDEKQANWSIPDKSKLYGELQTLSVNPLLVHPVEYTYSLKPAERPEDATDVEVIDKWILPDPPFYSDAA